MATYIKYDESHRVDFEIKPVWKNKWPFALDHGGSDIGLIGQGVVSQRFVLPGNQSKPMTLFCPLITAAQLAILKDLANYGAGPLEVKPEDAATLYNVIFAAENPLQIEQHAGEFPDEDKATAGAPWDRYKVTLNLIVV
jgi:hypothetical protein